MTSRRGWSAGRLAVALVLVAAPLGAMIGVSPDGAAAENDSSFDGAYLPAQRPPGYLLQTGSEFVSDSTGVSSRTILLRPDELGGQAVVQICAELGRHPSCPRGDRVLLRRAGPLRIDVALSGTPEQVAAAASYWRTARLVPADRITWITREG